VLSCGPDLLGTVAQVHPQVAENFGLEETSVYCIELDMAALEAHAQLDLHYTPLPKFPAVSRDLALICREDLPVAVLEKAIRKGAGKLLDKVEVFDVYQGEQIASGMKSVALRIVLQSADSTLTEEQINNAIQHAIQALEAAGATLRQA
jgi:phenylalanyl-tRNA synthetase beta chain